MRYHISTFQQTVDKVSLKFKVKLHIATHYKSKYTKRKSCLVNILPLLAVPGFNVVPV
jgi:hypothetical protein